MSNIGTRTKPASKVGNKPKKASASSVVKAPEKNISTPANVSLWAVAIGLVIGVSVFNQIYADHYNKIVRLIVVVASIAVALGAFALTNQGKKLIKFILEALLELKKIYWPTRKEAFQTSIIVVVISVLTSFMFWFFDSVIQALVTLITNIDIF